VLHPTGEKEDTMVIADIRDVQALGKTPKAVTFFEVAALCKDCPVEDIVGQIGSALPGARVSAIRQVVESRKAAVDQFRRLGLAVSAIVLARRGKSRDAVNRLERVAAEARRFGELSLLAAALAESVAPRLAIKERNRALEDAKAAVQLATKIGAKSAEGAALRALGLAVAANDGLKAAEGHFEAAVARYTALDNQLQAAETHSAWGDALRAGGQPVEAKAHYGLAVALFEAGSLRRRAAQARTSLVALAQ